MRKAWDIMGLKYQWFFYGHPSYFKGMFAMDMRIAQTGIIVASVASYGKMGPVSKKSWYENTGEW